MPKEQRRLTAVFAAFVAAVIKLGGDALASCAAAVANCIPEAEGLKRIVGVGALQAGLEAALPRDYAADVRGLVEAIGDENDKRGRAWAEQCLAAAIEEFLLKPLQAAAGDVVPKNAAPAKTAGKKK